MRVRADFDLCEANALCAGIAPETFELDDDDFLTILDDEVTARTRPRSGRPWRPAPGNALSIED